MSYNAKNYTEQGGEKTVIGGEVEIKGKLKIDEGAEVEGLPSGGTKLYLHIIGTNFDGIRFLSTKDSKYTFAQLVKVSPSAMPNLIFLPSTINSNGADASFISDGAGPGYTYQSLARKNKAADTWTIVTQAMLNNYTVTEF